MVVHRLNYGTLATGSCTILQIPNTMTVMSCISLGKQQNHEATDTIQIERAYSSLHTSTHAYATSHMRLFFAVVRHICKVWIWIPARRNNQTEGFRLFWKIMRWPPKAGKAHVNICVFGHIMLIYNLWSSKYIVKGLNFCQVTSWRHESYCGYCQQSLPPIIGLSQFLFHNPHTVKGAVNLRINQHIFSLG